MRHLVLITLLTAVSHPVSAQRMVPTPPHSTPGYNQGGRPYAFFYPIAFADSFYADSMRSPAASQPPVIVLQTPAMPAPVPERSVAPAQPLMIELRGDRYVGISGEESSEAQMIDSKAESPSPMEVLSHRVRRVAMPLASALLVFRDGHSEEISDYTITAGILYTSSDFYANGSWNKKIELSSLNLPETVSSNRSRGIRFQLPSAPNEVIVGP
jgi:hypothetical protein